VVSATGPSQKGGGVESEGAKGCSERELKQKGGKQNCPAHDTASVGQTHGCQQVITEQKGVAGPRGKRGEEYANRKTACGWWERKIELLCGGCEGTTGYKKKERSFKKGFKNHSSKTRGANRGEARIWAHFMWLQQKTETVGGKKGETKAVTGLTKNLNSATGRERLFWKKKGETTESFKARGKSNENMPLNLWEGMQTTTAGKGAEEKKTRGKSINRRKGFTHRKKEK